MIKRNINLDAINTIEQYQDLCNYLIEFSVNQQKELDKYKFKLANIQHILNSEINIQTEGIIKNKENE